MIYCELGLYRALTLFGFMALTLASTAALAKDVAPPEERGPFNIGVTTFSATMTGGRITKVQVFYPTFSPADEDFRYTISFAPGTYQLRSALGVTGDAEALPFRFPLIVHDHGGGPLGPDFQRVSQFPLHELLASHGFVVAVALHSANAVNRVRDLPLVIDALVARSAAEDDLLSDSIHPGKIGISGFSAGGRAAISTAAGWAAEGIAPDRRIKAMVLYEPSFDLVADASTIDFPYLVMGGLQSNARVSVPLLFGATTNASPRIYVLSPNAAHFNYLTGMGSEIDEAREQALLVDPTIPEPLTIRTASSAAAARAFDLWNQGEVLFGPIGPGAGGGRNYCDRVGVSSVRSLDVDGDGLTDSPPFLADDPLLPRGPAIREEVMVPMIKLYTIAFWKSYLEGDGRYMSYLTPGYAKRNSLEAIVEIE